MIGYWKVDFGTSRDWDNGKISSGFLVLSSSRWLVMQNDREEALIGRALENGEFIHVDSIVRFSSHMSKVKSCSLSPWPAKDPSPLRWKAWCSSFVNGNWSAERPGFLLLRPLAKRIVLLNQEEVLIDAHFLLEGETISNGVKIELPIHRVRVGDLILSAKDSSIDKSANITSSEKESAYKVTPPSLSFARGLKFKKDIVRKFGHEVNFYPGSRKRPFFLVATFGRTNFKLDNHTVSLSLQSCFGGSSSLFQVCNLRERVFRFTVSSRSVGFEIYNSGKISEKDFDLHIFLWGNGGPNCVFEEKKYYKELVEEWTVVSNKNKSKSVFQRLSFPPRILKSEVSRDIPAPTSWPNSIPLTMGKTVLKPKSYAQAVDNGFRHNDSFKPPNQFPLKQWGIWVQKKRRKSQSYRASFLL
jgi:hypothetical protein